MSIDQTRLDDSLERPVVQLDHLPPDAPVHQDTDQAQVDDVGGNVPREHHRGDHHVVVHPPLQGLPLLASPRPPVLPVVSLDSIKGFQP